MLWRFPFLLTKYIVGINLHPLAFICHSRCSQLKVWNITNLVHFYDNFAVLSWLCLWCWWFSCLGNSAKLCLGIRNWSLKCAVMPCFFVGSYETIIIIIIINNMLLHHGHVWCCALALLFKFIHLEWTFI